MKPRFGMGAPDEAAIAAQLKEIAQFLPVLDGGLAGKDWIAGELSIADFAIATTLVYRDAAGIDCSAAPNVLAWMERIEARPSWQKAVAPVTRLHRRLTVSCNQPQLRGWHGPCALLPVARRGQPVEGDLRRLARAPRRPPPAPSRRPWSSPACRARC